MDYQADTGGGGGGGNATAGSPFGGGGGYQGGSSQGGGGGGGKARKAYDEQTLIPVTARMIQQTTSTTNAEGTGSLALTDGRELYQVKLVGAVRAVESQSTNINFEIEDGTGLVEVKQWLDDNDCQAVAEMREQCLKENIYVKMVGQVKDYDGKKTLVAYSVRPLNSSNELTHHMLEVVYSQESAKRADSIVTPNAIHSNAMGGSSTSAGVGFGASSGSSGNQLQAASGGGGGQDDVQSAVSEYVRVEGERIEVGANVQSCIDSLTKGGRYNESQIRQAIDHLASEGHIYSTINEENYKFAQ